jgi:hypothetical protein
MFNKIYYAIGAGIILLYVGGSLVSMLTKNIGTPQARSVGVMRMEKGKYVYVPPTRSTRSGGGSYPSGGGYSGGK